MEVLISGLAIAVLLWMAWLLVKAKKFTRFKQLIEQELQPQVVNHLKTKLIESRCELTPNNDIHISATIFYWSQYKSRILQAALANGIIDEQWLKETGNYRNCQHLFHIEGDKLHRG